MDDIFSHCVVPPFNHQKEALRKGWAEKYFAFLFDPGLGKSKATIDNAVILFRKGKINALLIVAPLAVTSTWVDDQLLTHLPPDLHPSSGGSLVVRWRANSTAMQRHLWAKLAKWPADKLAIVVINTDAFSQGKCAERAIADCKWFCENFDVMMVVDESTRIKNADAKCTKNIASVGEYAMYRRILTGTIVANSPLDVYAQFDFLKPGVIGFWNFDTFKRRYAVVGSKKIAIVNKLDPEPDPAKKQRKTRTVFIVVNFQNLDELHQRIAPHCYIARKHECLDLPAKIYQYRDVELTPEQRRVYDDLEENCRAELETVGTCIGCGGAGSYVLNGNSTICSRCLGHGRGVGAHVSATMVMTRMLRLHQIVCGHVVDEDGMAHDLPTRRPGALVEMLEELPGQAIIWASYIRDVDKILAAIEAAFGPDQAMRHDGTVKQSERDAGLKLFKEKKIRFFVGTKASGGYGLNDLKGASYTIYYSNDFRYESRVQSEDRTHRIGQTETCVYVDMRAQDTIEDKIIKALRRKHDLASIVTGENARDWLIYNP